MRTHVPQRPENLKNSGGMSGVLYSCGPSGCWIKDGEIAFPVDGVTLGGSTLGLLKNIEAVANDLDPRGGLNSPSFKISEMTIGGKR